MQQRPLQYLCSPACAAKYAIRNTAEANYRANVGSKKELKASLKTKQDYEKELEKVVNEYIRLRDFGKPCISCDAPYGHYRPSAGHFYPAGSYKNIRFDEDNIHGQCWFNCNKNKHGNLTEYRPRLIAKIGQERFDALEARRNVPAHYSIPELIELKVIYKDKIKNLKTKTE